MAILLGATQNTSIFNDHPAIMDHEGFWELVQKNLSSSDFATAGKLVPLQGNNFINMVRNESRLSNMVTIVPFDREKAYLEFIDSSNRFLSVEAEATDPVTRRKATPSQKDLQPTRFIGILEITDWVYDLQIERETIAQTMLRIAADRTRNDLERIMINGNESGVLHQDADESGYAASKWDHDDFMESFDGVLQLVAAEGTTVNFGAFTTRHFSPIACAQMVRSVPQLRKSWLPSMKFFCSPNALTDFRFYWGQKGAEVTDKWWGQLIATPKFHNIDIVEIPLLDEFPKQSKVHSFTDSGTVQLDYYDVVSGSEHLVLDSITDYATPYIKDSDYTINAAGVVTHIHGGSMPTGSDILIDYQGGGMVLLMPPNNVYMAISRQDVELELWRDPIKGLNYFILRCRADEVIGDGELCVLGTNLNSYAYSTAT